jgi:hypothetical protein
VASAALLYPVAPVPVYLHSAHALPLYATGLFALANDAQ